MFFKVVKYSNNFRARAKLSVLLCTILTCQFALAEVVFEEDFDNQPDWHSELGGNDKGGLPNNEPDTAQYKGIHTIPKGWHAVRQDPTWSPIKGHSDRHPVIEINSKTIAENRNRAKGGGGKSFVTWRDSHDPGWKRWNSDGILYFRLPGKGLEEVYVEFWINFSNETIASFYREELGMSKLLRITHHDDPDNFDYSNYWDFFGNNNKPNYIWTLQGNLRYGIENKYSIHRYTGRMDLNETIPNLHRQFSGGGNVSSYSPTSSWGPSGHGIGGTSPELADNKNGGVIRKGPVMMDQLYGDETVWVKYAHYLKLNSRGGVADGELHHYVNDQRVLHLKGIEWVTVEQDREMTLWNMVGFGGNDYFKAFTNAHRHEEWYAIDDIVIRSSLPERLKQGGREPRPPSGISVELKN